MDLAEVVKSLALSKRCGPSIPADDRQQHPAAAAAVAHPRMRRCKRFRFHSTRNFRWRRRCRVDGPSQHWVVDGGEMRDRRGKVSGDVCWRQSYCSWSSIRRRTGGQW